MDSQSDASSARDVGSAIETSPYAHALGVEVEALAPAGAHARLVLPYRDANANPGRALHGGCAASLAVVGGHAIARAALGPASGPWHTAQLQVGYLAAAIGEDVVADARLLRRGKELCFVAVDVATRDGKPVAHATATVRGRFGSAPPALARSAGDHGGADPGRMGPGVGKLAFVAARGIRVEHMQSGTSRLVMPASDANADAEGGVHEGAVLALVDTTGAMASWAEVGPGPYKASTPSLQVELFAPVARADLVAYGRCVQRDAEVSWSEVEVVAQPDARVVARGTVLYRIVT